MPRRPSDLSEEHGASWVCPHCVARSTKPTCVGCGLRETDARNPVRLWRVVLGVAAFVVMLLAVALVAILSFEAPRG